jgi:hypothetical protein
LSGVMLAEMVYHVFDETPPEWDAIPAEMAESQATPSPDPRARGLKNRTRSRRNHGAQPP